MKAGIATGAAFSFRPAEHIVEFQTKHLIWIINGNGSRKKDWYENPAMFPNYARLVREGFVYEESLNDTVANHDLAVLELLTGNAAVTDRTFPTPLHYARKAYGDSATRYWMINSVSSYGQWCRSADCLLANEAAPVHLVAAGNELRDTLLSAAEKRRTREFLDDMFASHAWETDLENAPIPRSPFVGDAAGFAAIPHVLKEFKPRMIVFHQVGHDTGHGDADYLRKQSGYFEYQKVCRTTDEQLGHILDFVKNDPYFSRHTAIVIRPEFGRDDEVNEFGQLNHSCGYDQTCRSAEIWWGPDFKSGVEKRVTNRRDVVPTIARLFNVEAPFAQGQPHLEMFKDPRSARM
jgi:hypothetical protein